MDLASILNLYCRRIGIWFLSALPIILTILLIYQTIPELWERLAPEKFKPDNFELFTAIIYLLLIIIALPFALNGFFMEQAFNNEIDKIQNSGLLIQGIKGFNDIKNKIKLLYRGSYSVSATVIISFLVFISAVNLQEITDFARLFLIIACIGLLAISSGASILLKLPDKSALQPGGLMKFYSPKSQSLLLDNILTDSIFSQLDPITRIRMDEWSRSIQKNLNKTYMSEFDDYTRLERAREKVLLLVYLKESIPNLMSKDTFIRELSEIIEPEYLNKFLQGVDSGISLLVLQTIMNDVKREIPNVFELVQRIFVLVTDNLRHLQSRNEFVTICYPNSHIGNIDPFRIIIFILNLNEIKRNMHIKAQTSMSSLDPDDASQTLVLDEGTLLVPDEETKLDFSSSIERVDVLRLVSEILQIGDALTLQFRANRYGTHVLNISVEDTEYGGIIAGESVVIDVHRDLNYYAKTISAKLIGYVGAALSFIGIGLGSLTGFLLP